MPDASAEVPKAPKTVGDAEQTEQGSEAGAKDLKREKDEAKKVISKAKEAKVAKPKELPAEKSQFVRDVARHISEGKDVVFSQKDVGDVRKLLSEYSGVDSKVLAKLNDEQIFFVVNELFGKGDSKVKFEDIARRLIFDAAEDFGSVSTKSVGALAREWVENLPEADQVPQEVGRFINRIRRVADMYGEDEDIGNQREELTRVRNQFADAFANDRLGGASEDIFNSVDDVLSRRIVQLRPVQREKPVGPIPPTAEENAARRSIDQLVELQTGGQTRGTL